MNRFYSEVAERAGHRCEYCRAPEVVLNFPFEVEHIIPPCAGGEDELANFALSCRSCNVFKSAVVLVQDEEIGVDVKLFHPRRDEWTTHNSLSVSRERTNHASDGHRTSHCSTTSSQRAGPVGGSPSLVRARCLPRLSRCKT